MTASEYSAHIAKVQEDHPSAYGPWTTEQDERLIQRYKAGASLQELADEFGRTVGGIKSRIRWHNLPPRRAKVDRDDDPAADYVDLGEQEQDDDWQ